MKLHQKHTFWYCFVALFTGIILGNFLVKEFQSSYNFLGFYSQEAVIILGATLISGVLICCFYVKKNSKLLISAILFFGAVGCILGLQTAKEEQTDYHPLSGEVTFSYQERLRDTPKHFRYIILSENSNFLLLVPKKLGKLHPDRLYTAQVSLYPIASPVFDFQFDYAKHLKRKKITHQAVLPESFSEKINTNLKTLESVALFRKRLIDKLEENIHNKEIAGFTTGLILGDRTGISEKLQTDFRQSGLMHILAISGSHMLIIFAIIYKSLRLFLPNLKKNIGTMLALLAIWLFALLIDFGPSVVRSCIMLSMYYSFYILQKRSNLSHAMGVSGILILAWDPFSAFDVGFQLSFAAVLGIGIFTPVIKSLITKKLNKVQYWFVQIFCVSLAAQLMIIPIMLFYFGQMSLGSLFSNLIMIPLGEIIIIFAFVLVFLCSFIVLPGFLVDIYSGLCTLFFRLINFFAHLPGTYLSEIPFSLVEMLVSYLILMFIYLFLKLKKPIHFYYLLYSLFSFFIISNCLFIYQHQTNEELYGKNFQYEAHILKSGNHAEFIITTELTEEKVKSFIVNPYLRSRRIDNYTLKILAPNKQ